METIAEGAKQGVKQARRHIQKLKSFGYIVVIANANGGTPGATPRYKMNFSPVISQKTAPSYGSPTPPSQGSYGSHEAAITPPTHGSLNGSQSLMKQAENSEKKWNEKPIGVWTNGDYAAAGNHYNIKISLFNGGMETAFKLAVAKAHHENETAKKFCLK
jgi:hypothetical protein